MQGAALKADAEQPFYGSEAGGVGTGAPSAKTSRIIFYCFLSFGGACAVDRATYRSSSSSDPESDAGGAVSAGRVSRSGSSSVSSSSVGASSAISM